MTRDRRMMQSGHSAQRQRAISPSVLPASEYATFGEFARLLWNNKGTFSLFLLGGAVLAAGLAFTQKPVYEARALVEVEMPNEDYLNRRQLSPVAEPGMILLEPFLQTQVKLLQSDTLLLTVIDKLNLTKHAAFNATPTPLAQLKRLITRNTPQPVTDRGVLEAIRKNLIVRLAGQTQIVEIILEAPDPQLAADFVNGLADGYREQALQRMVKSSTQTEELLSGQIDDQKSSLDDAGNKLRDFVSRNGLLVANNAERESFSETQLRQVQSALGVAHEARVAAQSQYEAVRTATPDALGRMLDSDTLKSYRVKLADLQQQLAENSEVLKPAHYRVRQIQAEIDSLQHDFDQERAGILARLKSQYEAARFREESLTHDYDRQARTVAGQMGKSILYNELKRDLETRRQLYDSTLQKVKEAGVVSAIQASNVHVVDPAVAPERPTKPNKVLYSAIGLSAGALIGLVFVFAKDRRRKQQVQAVLPGRIDANVRQLGTIPMLPVEIHDISHDGNRTQNLPATLHDLAGWRGGDPAIADSFRKLLPHLLYSSKRASRPRVLTITSATHGEGRTFVACNLAAVLAESGRKVLLVDGDRMNPRLHEVFGVENEAGFTELILQQPDRSSAKSTDTVWSTGVANLFVSPGGKGMARMATLSHDPRMPATLDRLCAHFDMILIDTPPVFSDGDALAFGQQADAVLMVSRPGQASQELFAASVGQCLEHGLPVIGKLVNGGEVHLHALAS